MIILELTINNQIMSDIQLQIGGGNKQGNLTIIDNVTGQTVNATFSGQQVVSNSNPAAANFEIPPGNPNMVIGVPIAEGSGAIVVSAHVDYTDPGDGSAQSQDVSVTKNFTVSSVSGPHGVTFDVVFN